MRGDDAVKEASIEKSRYNDKSRYYNGVSADWGLSQLGDFAVDFFYLVEV